MNKTCKEYFGERLRLLRIEKGLSQDALSKDLRISKGALSYYENCARTLDIVVLDKVSKYFNVSLDYLMGYTDNKTTDLNIKAMSEYTGLSEKALNEFNLKIIKWFGNYNDNEITEDEIKELRLRQEAINAIIESGYLFSIVGAMTDLEEYSKQCLSLKATLNCLRSDDIFKIAEKLGMEPSSLFAIIAEKIEKNENYKKSVSSEYCDDLENKCNLCRYLLIKISEEISDGFDYRFGYLDYNREELLKFLTLTEEDIKNKDMIKTPTTPPQE